MSKKEKFKAILKKPVLWLSIVSVLIISLGFLLGNNIIDYFSAFEILGAVSGVVFAFLICAFLILIVIAAWIVFLVIKLVRFLIDKKKK